MSLRIQDAIDQLRDQARDDGGVAAAERLRIAAERELAAKIEAYRRELADSARIPSYEDAKAAQAAWQAAEEARREKIQAAFGGRRIEDVVCELLQRVSALEQQR